MFLLPHTISAADAKAKRVPAKSAKGGPANPPDTDFSAFEKKVPWIPSDEFLDAAAARQKAPNFFETKVAPYPLPD